MKRHFSHRIHLIPYGRYMMNRAIGYETYEPLVARFVSLVLEAMADRIVSIVLYGSVARSEARPESDMDLLLVTESAPPSYRARLEPMLPILRHLRHDPSWKALEARGAFPSFSLLVLSRKEADRNRYIYLDMIQDARILIDRQGFFLGRLKALESRLHELGARKIRQNGNWYWDLKPDLAPGEVLVL